MDPLDRVSEVLEVLAYLSTIGSFLLGLWNILTGQIKKHKRKRMAQKTEDGNGASSVEK